ncbi:MAG TPA: cadherin domain-containing protein [Thermoanaerobaculia bacterium]|nr:cadherin domain-containing protein [Thermoanaerobaculia bacterium]
MDRDATTGCTVAGMPGVEQVLVTRVVSDATTAAVTRTFRRVCSGGALGAETDVDSTGWSVGFHTASGRMVIETRVPFSVFGAEVPRMHLGVQATQGALSHTEVGLSDGSLVIFPETPRGKRRASSAPGSPRMITLDGVDGDWAGLPPIFNGIAAGGTNGLRIVKVNAYANSNDDFLYFLFDLNVSTDAPIAVDDSYERPAGAGLTVPAPGVLDNDEDPNGLPLTATPVSPAAHGNVTLNPDGGFTYTPNDPASTQTDAFEYKASNGAKESSAARVTISVDGGAGDNQAPVFTSTANHSVPEGTTNVVTIAAIDPDGDTVTYSITGGADETKFTLQGGTNLVFNSAPDFEAPLSGGGTNTYVVEVTADDGNGGTNTQTITVNVTNADEVPSFTSPNTFSVDENTTAVGTVSATDPDGTSMTYAVGGTDAARFTINASTGALSFTTAPNFEAPTDAGSNNVYTIQITGTDATGSSTVQTVNVTVNDVNEAPVFTSTASPSVPENTTTVVTVTVDDPENNAITYSITGGADAARFSINATTGALTFNASPDFEAPTDADANNAYVVQVTATDGTNPVTQSLIVTVTNVNEAPTITSANAASVPENTTAVTTVTTTDPENNSMTYSITGGDDAADFAINATTGALSFVTPPNFEAPADADTNNVYVVTVNAHDGANNVSQTITVTVTNVNEAPAFTSTATPSVPENTTAVLTVTTADQEGQGVTYALTGGADQARFAINAATGALTFLVAPNFEAPTDSDTNNTYVVQVTATDGTNAVSQTITATVTNVNEAPVITSANAVSIPENILTVQTITATDQENDTITYSISGGADAGDFTIDPNTGVLLMMPPANYEAPDDADTNNQYIVEVTATDGTTPVNQTVTVTVTDVNETPVVTSTTTPTVAENNTAVTTITTTDEEGDAITFSIVPGGADNAFFSVNSTTGALTFNAAPDFEAPADADANNVYIVTVRVSDGVNNDDRPFSVTVTNANEAPVASDATFSLDENSANGTSVGGVSASDQDASQTLTYAITAGNALGAFTINSSTGVITVADVTDVNFEVNPTFTLTVTATDNGTGNLSDTAAITINLTNLNEAPVVDAATVAIDENSANGTAVHTVTFTEPDTTGQTHTFAITGGDPSGAFAIHPTTGAITVANQSLINHEATQQFTLTVEVTDAGAPAPALSDTAVITVNVNDVDEAPVFTSGTTANVAENTAAVMTVTATDQENNTLSYSITGGDDSGAFSIHTSTGALTFNASPNFESPTDSNANNVYVVEVTVTDGTTPVAQMISVTVTDVNEAPQFTAGLGILNVAENGTTVTDLNTSDPENDTVTFSISGGPDAADFSVDPNTGIVTFNVAPNFEAPHDANLDNQYEVEVTATDGTTPVAETLFVNVTNANEAPSFTSSATPNAVEGNTDAVTVTTTDPEGNAVTYTITGGADMALFNLDTNTGELRFLSAPNFESPADSGNDNVYDVQVTANDGTNNSVQNITVTVTDADEAPSFTSSETPSVPENSVVATTVTTTDPEGQSVTYSITGGNDAADFSIDTNSGVLSFQVVPNFEAPHDADANNVYLVQVTATDGTTPIVQDLVVTVTAVDEAPTFTTTATVSLPENTIPVITVQASDQEGQSITYSITGGADQTDFLIHPTNGDLRFDASPNFEAPHDADTDNVYHVQVTATDGTTPVVQNLTITITDANEAPTITSGNFSVAENSTAVGTVTASDEDGDTPTYAIVGSTDSSYFAIDETTGDLSFLAPPNFEAPADSGGNNVYEIIVRATNGGALFSDLPITVTVTNVNEAPVFTSGASPVVAENTTAVVTVQANDPELQSVSYSITGGADQLKFTIHSTTGALSFLVAPDFEAPGDTNGDNTYIVEVTATDGSVPAVQTVTVAIADANDPPAFTSSATPNAAENQNVAVDVNAVDPEAGPVTYSITGGDDQTDFTIDTGSGVVSFLATPNFESPHDADANNTYLVQVTATDGMNPAVQNITVTVTNVNEAPSITSTNTYSIPENVSAVTTVTTTDPENDTITYSISGGADQSDFSVDPTSGALTFAMPPNFEAPADSDLDNVYTVQVTANDGVNSVNQTVTVTVTNADEAPEFATANTASVPENTTAVVTLSATDPEGLAVTYSLTGGADQADFAVNGTTGALTFNPAPNFEAPADADTNNDYVVQVTATDGVNPVNLTITVTVTNVNEAPVNTVPAGAQATPEDTNLVFPGTISVSDPDGDVTVQVTLTATKGTLSTNGVTGLAFTTGDGTDDPTLVFTGTTTDVNARLNGLTFKPAQNYYSNDLSDTDDPGTVTILTNDQGNTGSGGAQSSNGGTPNSVTVNINAVNDKPATPSYTVANGNAHVTHSAIGITISASDTNELKEDSTDVDNHDPYSELTVQLVAGSISPANSTVTLIDASTGAFYFEPPGGLSGSAAASFQYRVCDNGSASLGLAAECSDPATVQFTITGTDTWFVDDLDAAGCGVACNGSRTKPLVGLNHVALTTRGTGDRVFAFSGTYNHGFTMAANERLIGQASTGAFDSHFGVVVPGNGTLDTRPSLSGGAVTLQSTLTAANNTLLRGISISSSGINKGYVATGATTLTVLESSVNATGTTAIDVTGATNAATSVAFTSTSSGAGARGISLDGVNGTWSLGTGSLNGHTQAAFYLQNSNAAQITYSGSMAPNAAGRAVLIGTPDGNAGSNASNGMEAGTSITLSGNITAGGVAVYESTGGTLNLTGTTQTWNTGANRGVDLIDNHNGSTGATINFSSGNLNITTNGATGFHASQGGTINVMGTNNTISTTNGIGFEATGTSGEHLGGGFAWKSISSTNGTKGVSAQFLDGAFSISGDGADGDTLPDNVTAGGTISGSDQRGIELVDVDGPITLGGITVSSPADTAGPDPSVAAGTCGNIPSGGSNTGCYAGLHLDTVANVTLRTINVASSGSIGINGNSINGLTIDTVNVSNTGNASGEDGMRLYNLHGSGSVSALAVTSSFGKGLLIENTNVSLGTAGSPYLITNSNFQGSSNAQGANLNTAISGTMHVKFVNGTISNNFSNGIQTASLGSGTLGIYIDNTSFSNNTSAVVVQSSGGTTSFDIRNIDHVGRTVNASCGLCIKSDGSGVANGTIENNLIGNGTVGSGASCGGGCNGINIDARNTSDMTVAVRGNTIRNVDQNGIGIRGGEGSSKLDVTLTGNLIKDPDGAATLAAIFADSGVLSSDTNCVTVLIGGNTAWPGSPTTSTSDVQNRIEGAWANSGVRVRKLFGAGVAPEPVFNLPGYDGSSVATWIQNDNSFSGVATPVTFNTGNGGNFTGAASCP